LVNTKLGDAKPLLSEQIKENDPCKEGDYYEGGKKVTAEYVKSKIRVEGERQIPFNGMACIGGKLKQASCRKDKNGKLDCEEPIGY